MTGIPTFFRYTAAALAHHGDIKLTSLLRLQGRTNSMGGLSE